MRSTPCYDYCSIWENSEGSFNVQEEYHVGINVFVAYVMQYCYGNNSDQLLSIIISLTFYGSQNLPF